MVLLDVAVDDACCFSGLDDGLHGDHAVAEFLEVLLGHAVVDWKGESFFEVLEVKLRNAAVELFDQGDGIDVGSLDPEDIDLEFHFRRKFFGEDIVARGALHGLKFEGVIVVGKLDACFFRNRGSLVEIPRDALVAIEILTVLVVKVGDDEVSEFGLVCFFDDFFEVRKPFIGWVYGGLPLEVSGVEREAVIVGGFDHVIALREAIHFALLVACLDERFDRARSISLEGIADGIHLKTDVCAVDIVRGKGAESL